MPEYIHPKAVDAALQPEAKNVQHFLDDFGITPVEVGLFAQEGMVVILLRMRVVFPSASTKARQPVVQRPAASARAAPDIPVALGVVARRPRLNKPRMLIGTVIGDKIQDDFEITRMRLSDQSIEIREGAEQRVDRGIVRHIVAEVLHWRRVNRRDPNGGEAEPAKIIQP